MELTYWEWSWGNSFSTDCGTASSISSGRERAQTKCLLDKWSLDTAIRGGKEPSEDEAAGGHTDFTNRRTENGLVNSIKMLKVQASPLTVTPVTVTQYRAFWLQWHFSYFPIGLFIVKHVWIQWHSMEPSAYSESVTLFGRPTVTISGQACKSKISINAQLNRTFLLSYKSFIENSQLYTRARRALSLISYSRHKSCPWFFSKILISSQMRPI